MTSSHPNLGLYLQPLACTSTILLGLHGLSTSIFFVPALLRPVTSVSSNGPPSSSSGTKTPTLSVPQTPMESGRLTPQTSHRAFDFALHLGSSGTYKAVACQFARLHSLSTAYNVPLETIAVASYGMLAYRARGTVMGKSWAAAGAVLVGVDILKAWFMAPLALKVLRVAGDAEPVEPYEDAPIDREAEKRNTVQFLRKWNMLNLGSSLVLLGTAALAWGVETW
ncbi:uncharacterized protein SEPMUDRAFT_53430 [Sphaerulina musiva SO2202]|uniref:DUF1772-domain-containing protein n=1 Tax=Sphaerulina musiva (strain SO2202) TaxID=692275 RepID=M3AUH0_SPHMS|nr:uncharacterized protein SEPMUDRAFT_53430 [Sphaerulina musiva SO2202]EMF09149.1 hypothetical protein SEPMUDRAFT_53430 [Sphaerulina musiva SO2202]